MAFGDDKAGVRPTRPGGHGGHAHEAVRPPHRRSQYEGVLVGGELEVLGQLEVKGLGYAAHGLVQYLRLIWAAEPRNGLAD